MSRSKPRLHLIAGIVLGVTVTCLLFNLHVSMLHHQQHPSVNKKACSGDESVSPRLAPDQEKRPPPVASFKSQYLQLRRDLNDSLYYFDRPGRLIPLMRLSEAEQRREHRVAAGRAWLRTQGVVVAATVRDGMSGLPSCARNLRRLRNLFSASWLVFVENESQDATRSFLYNWTQQDPTVRLLGCDTVNSPAPCRLNIRYSSGRQHVPGYKVQRTFQDEVERGLVMSALRNEYLHYVYDNLVNHASLLLVIDPDVSWTDWDLDNIAQGAYYFMAKPKLQQLCAHSIMYSSIYDPCTLAFYLNKHFGEDRTYPTVTYERSILNATPDLPPVKVESCFQAFAFYRLTDLAVNRLRYTRSMGEWMCEHNTLSRQLREVYIDPQMKLRVRDENVG